MSTINLRIAELVQYFSNGNNSDFGNKIGVNEANIRNYINGTEPKFSFLEKICNNFEISFEWLLTGKEPMLKEPPQPTPVQEAQHSNNDNEVIALLREKIALLEENKALQAEKIADLEEKLKFAEFRDKKDMDFKIKAQRKEKKEKDEIIIAQTNTINELNEENNALKSRYLPPDKPLQPSKKV